MSYLEKDVSDLVRALWESVDEETGEVKDCDLLAFEELTAECIAPKMERMQKARNYFKGEVAAIEDEIKRLQNRKKSFERQEERLAERILYGLKSVESWGAKLKTSLFTFGTRKTQKLIVEDGAEKNIPAEFIKMEISVDKAGLKKHVLETGEIFDGVKLETTESLQVR